MHALSFKLRIVHTVTRSEPTVPKLTKGQKTRQAIINEATNILVNEGYENFVIRQIAKRVGIQPGNLQYYYPTKKELLWEVLTPESDKYEDTYLKLAEKATTKSGKVLALVDFLIADIREKATCNIWFTIWALAPHDDEVAEIMDRFYLKYNESLSRLLRHADPDMPEQRSKHLACLLTALFDGMTNQIGYGKSKHEFHVGIEDELRSAVLALVGVS